MISNIYAQVGSTAVDYNSHPVLHSAQVRGLLSDADRGYHGGCQHRLGQSKERQRTHHSVQRRT